MYTVVGITFQGGKIIPYFRIIEIKQHVFDGIFHFRPQGLAPYMQSLNLSAQNSKLKTWLSSKILRLSQSLGIQVIWLSVAVVWQTLQAGLKISSLQLDSSLTDLPLCLGQQCAHSRTCTFFKTPLKLEWPQPRSGQKDIGSSFLRGAFRKPLFS